MALNDSEYTQMADILNGHRLKADQTRNKKMLPDDRIKQMARDFKTAKAALDDVNARSDKRTRAESERAWKQAFALPASADGTMILAFRDAVDRVSKASPQEVSRLLAQGMDTNDRTLAAACGAHAFSQANADPLQSSAWGRIVETYAGTSPAKQQAISTLAAQAADANDRAATISRNMMRHVPVPPELRGQNIDALAAMPLSTEEAE